MEAFPNVPVSTALGHNITLPQFRVILVKAGTDASHVKLLSDALAKAAASPDFKAYLKEQYADEGSFIAGGESIRYMQAWLDDAKKIIASTPKK